MIRILRKSWLTLTILIWAAAFVPIIISFINHPANQTFDSTMLLVGVWIFMIGVVFALICLVLPFISAAMGKGAPKPKA